MMKPGVEAGVEKLKKDQNILKVEILKLRQQQENSHVQLTNARWGYDRENVGRMREMKEKWLRGMREDCCFGTSNHEMIDWFGSLLKSDSNFTEAC
ncbi:hypothetical protein VIGAN_04170800 [Vigna angularis var. angularis]|uniref:Uncharacterized protein n=1 Tax=Vigna angularis var. angularis TaxID=157739 RepID=A0A0S3RUR5_PHAAN|nr:hypothetical protein VIGAN_04170800 [Vigna angularis var. angularis]